MAQTLVTDEFWEFVRPFLPRHKAGPGKRGRPPVDDRACLTGILFVLQSGIPWRLLPREMGCGSGTTCWRRMRYWQRRGVWKRVLEAVLDRLGQEGLIDWSKAVVDSQSFRAVFGGDLQERILRIGPKMAASVTCSSTATARRWPSGSPELSGTTRGKPSRCSTASRPSVSRVEGPGVDLRASTGTGRTARRATTRGSGKDTSRTTWPNRAHRMAADSERSAGSSKGRSPGSGRPGD